MRKPEALRPDETSAGLKRDEHRLRRRLICAVVVTAAVVPLILAVPSLRHVAATIKHMSPGWIALAVALELASDSSFAVIFRLFFDGVPAPVGRELAWTEEASGALLPGGGVEAYAVGGWLLHRAGISTRRILKRSSGLFFLTSATNVAAMAGAGALLAAGVGHSPGRIPARGGSGYLANLIPIPGGVGVLASRGGRARLSRDRVLGPSLGGIAAYCRLRCGLRDSRGASGREREARSGQRAARA